MSSFDDLEFFVRLVQHSSLSAMARTAGMTTGAISIRLQKLETNLGVRLLNRSTRKWSLTHEGELLFDRGMELLDALNALNRSVSLGKTEARGLLRINAPRSLGRYRISPFLAEFKRLHPELQLQLELSDQPIDLIDRGFDLAIRYGAPPDSRLIARRLAPCRRALYASPIYLAEFGQPAVPADLRHHHCILKNDEIQGWTLEHNGQREHVRIQSSLRSNDGETLLSWAMLGHGILSRHDWYVGSFVRAGNLVPVLPDWSFANEAIFAVYPARANLAAKVSLCIEFLLNQFSALREPIA